MVHYPYKLDIHEAPQDDTSLTLSNKHIVDTTYTTTPILYSQYEMENTFILYSEYGMDDTIIS